MSADLDRLTAALADRYTIERELGAGGMATVYLAEDLKHHRPVALKGHGKMPLRRRGTRPLRSPLCVSLVFGLRPAPCCSRQTPAAPSAPGGPGPYISVMVVDTPQLRQFEAEYQRTAYRQLSVPDALALYQRLLGEARALDPAFGLDWEADLASDLAIARAINGLSAV